MSNSTNGLVGIFAIFMIALIIFGRAIVFYIIWYWCGIHNYFPFLPQSWHEMGLMPILGILWIFSLLFHGYSNSSK